jgi:hypothetical protein
MGRLTRGSIPPRHLYTLMPHLPTHKFSFVESEVLKAVIMKGSVFWDITPCRGLNVSRLFGGTCRHYLHAGSADMFLRNVGWHSMHHTALYPRRYNPSRWPLFLSVLLYMQCDSTLLSGFPWPIIFKPEKTKQNETAYGIWKCATLYSPHWCLAAPPPWARIVREFLDMHFPGLWVGRDGPIP